MSVFVELASQLIISEIGSLVYHLVLVLSIAGALQTCLRFWNKDSIEMRRMVWGLTGLLLLRVILFLVAGFAWQGILDPGKWLPLLERAASLTSLVIIIWLWAFPRPSRAADAATILMVVLVFTLSLVAGLQWLNANPAIAYNRFLIAQWLCLLALAYLLFGMLVLLESKPSGWENGFAMMIVLVFGYGLQFLGLQETGNYSAAIRISEIIAYPFLLALPHRHLASLYDLNLDHLQTHQAEGLEIFRMVGDAANPQAAYQVAAKGLGKLVRADLCLLVVLSNDERLVNTAGGYDLRSDQPLIPAPIERGKVPLVVSALLQNRMLRLPAASSSPDMSGLAEALKLESPGHLLLLPASTRRQAGFNILLLSPYSRRSWTSQDIDLVEVISEPLARFLQQFDEMAILQTQLFQAQNQLSHFKSRVQSDQVDQTKALEELHSLQQNEGEKQSQLKTLAAMVALQQDALNAANQKVQSLQAEMVGKKRGFSQVQLSEISSLVAKLELSVHSIQEYADFLLSESMGILGALQRKFVERIRLTTEDTDKLAGEIKRRLSPAQPSEKSAYDAIGLGEVVDAVVGEVAPHLRGKRVALRMDLPETLPDLETDSQTLKQALALLLKHAGEVTPKQGQILLRALVEEDGSQPEYVILQIVDGGGGISPADLPYVFTAPSATTQTGQIDLSNLPKLVDVLRGRIWVDNEPGRGSTFNLLLPVLASAKGSSDLPGSLV
jgi:signal transduction histidine kinase